MKIDPAISGKISCGVAGWFYPDWDGYVYHPAVTDKLRFTASHVDCIEINNTFYKPPEAKTVDFWVQRTNGLPGFFFTAKLHQDFTHHVKLDDDMAQAFYEGFKPMTEVGRLRHLLAQFRYDFDDTKDNRAHLQSIADRFRDLANVVLELRHVSWQKPRALDFVVKLGATLCNLDYPTTEDSFNLQVCAVGDNGYFRLHGRNAASWFDRNAGRDQTYNYCYGPAELQELHERCIEVAKMSKTLTLIANNHYQGKEMVNALQLKSMITGKKVKVPPLLIVRYPQLKTIAEI